MGNTSVQKILKIGRTNKVFLVFPLIVALLLVVGGLHFYTSTLNNKHVLGTSNINNTTHALGPKEIPQTPVPLMNNQKMELANGTSTKTKKKSFEITGGNYYFQPNKITVNQGDTVTIIFLDLSGLHNFVIDNLNVRIPTISPGRPGLVTFKADKKGTFEFSSSLPQDQQMGMKGTLTVK